MIYTNYDTYTYDLEPVTCNVNKELTDIFDFDLLELPQTKYFYVAPWIEGETIYDITKDDFYYLKDLYEDKEYTPFYNQMIFNIVRSFEDDKPYVIDYKHFEYKKDLPFFIYFYNKKYKINTLYYETDLEQIQKHLEIDYPIREAKIVRFTKK
jgi:hypothetical protein